MPTPNGSFEEIALPLLPSVARVARALASSAAEAEDLVQETFLRALRFWHTFQQGTDCRRWLATICRNAHFAQRQREARVVAVEDDELESLASVRVHKAARGAGLEELFDQVDLGPAIRAAIDRLGPAFRSVVLLCDVEGFSYEECAEMLDVPVGTVRSRLFRARRTLQESLLAYAIDAGIAPPRHLTPVSSSP